MQMYDNIIELSISQKTIHGIITVQNDRNALYFLKERRFIQIDFVPPTMKCTKEIFI